MNMEIGDAPPGGPITFQTPFAPERGVEEARRLFRRTLASWASDLLLLRSRGARAIRWTGATYREAA